MVIDIIIVLIIALCIFAGYKKGLMGVLFKIVSFILALIIALIIALILHGPISNFIINNTNIDENLETLIINNIDPNNEVIDENGQLKENSNNSETIQEYITNSIGNVKDGVENAAARSIAITIINIAVLILILLITRIILGVLNIIIDIVAKLPIIKQFNTAGGLIFGAVEGLIIVYVLLAICALIAPLFGDLQLINSINNSTLGKLMYDNNILLKIML